MAKKIEIAPTFAEITAEVVAALQEVNAELAATLENAAAEQVQTVATLQATVEELTTAAETHEATIAELMATAGSGSAKAQAGVFKHKKVSYTLVTPKFYASIDGNMTLVTAEDLEASEELVELAIKMGNLVPVKGDN